MTKFMTDFRAILINFVQVMMVVIIGFGVLLGFIFGGIAAGGGGFSFFGAIFGAAFGFVTSATSMAVLAILLDIRQSLLNADARAMK